MQPRWEISKFVYGLEANCRDVIISEEQIRNAKLFGSLLLFYGSDTMFNTPGFDVALLGDNGQHLVDSFDRYNYDDHHDLVVNVASTDMAMVGGEAFWLTFQFGRVGDALRIMNEQNLLLGKMLLNKLANGYRYSLWMFMMVHTSIAHLHGLHDDVRKVVRTLGITFKTAQEWFLREVSDGLPTFTSIDYKWDAAEVQPPGVNSTLRQVWQLKCILIVCCDDIPKSDAIAFLESLPDDEGIIAVSLTAGTHDNGVIFGVTMFYWLALAHEKVGLYAGAIRFAELQLGPKCRANSPLTIWPQVVGLHCKARSLAKMNRHQDALATFQQAIQKSKASFVMIQALAFRELARYGAAPPDVAARANADMEASLATFDSRSGLTRPEFDALYRFDDL